MSSDKELVAQLRVCGDCARSSPDDFTYLNGPGRIMVREAATRLETVTAERDEQRRLADGWRDTAAAEHKSMEFERARAEAAEASLGVAEKALEPFAACADHYDRDGYRQDEAVIDSRSWNEKGETRARLIRADFRAAREALSTIKARRGE